MNSINVGDIVTPRTPAGLQITKEPCNGEYNQKRKVTCIFKGKGTVIEIKDIIIDYTTWPPDYEDIGKINYRCCKIKCETGIGWGGEGALIKLVKRKE